eukprot:TRINITY_DN13807_c0_g1_i1.p1 TRINITY_DN13807_c0_g1~~TRINITY_DN13807_c0_g1_i1.p1  ORF type:complete len:275 (+),score=90.16 TRINITY_DN13807_c0_g1_i1:147-971(+)
MSVTKEHKFTENLFQSSEWDKKAEEYEESTNDVTRRLGIRAIEMIKIHDGAVILDNACGSGIITEEILNINPNVRIYATDFSGEMVSMVKRKSEKNGWKNVEAQVQNSQDLKFEDNFFDISITNFGLMFSEEDDSLSHIHRTLKPGGKAVVTTWLEGNFALGLEVAKRIAGRDVEPKGKFAEILKNGWSRPDWIKESFKRVGFSDVEITIREDLSVIKGKFLNQVKMWKEALTSEFTQEQKDSWESEWNKTVEEMKANGTKIKMVAIISIATKN